MLIAQFLALAVVKLHQNVIDEKGRLCCQLSNSTIYFDQNVFPGYAIV